MNLEVVIPTYNRAEKLKLRLDELFVLQSKNSFGISVLDNASTDGTEGIASSYLGRPGFRYSRALVNGGISRNIMRCFEETKGDWIWTLSDDDPTKDDDIDIILKAIKSGRGDIYIFKGQGNYIQKDAVYRSPLEFLQNQSLLSSGYLSTCIYSRKAILTGMHVLAPSAYTLLPHCLLAISAVAKGLAICFDKQELCRPDPDTTKKRISRKEFALGAIVCLEFFDDPQAREIAARQFRAYTRWILLSALAQTISDVDLANWKRTVAIVDSVLAKSGASFLSSFRSDSIHTMKDIRREFILGALSLVPLGVLRFYAKMLAERSGQDKCHTLFDNTI